MVDQPGPLSDVEFHQTLNVRLWDGMLLRPEVRLHLLRSAMAFYRFLDVPGLPLSDVVLTGSNCAFNYTNQSDLDVHLVVPFARTVCPDLAENFFTTKKALWNQTHDVTVEGHAVELYVEDDDNPARSSGLYSLIGGEWLRKPSHQKPRVDDAAITRKVEGLVAEIEAMMTASPRAEDVGRLIDRLRAMRRAGLETGGEFSVENIAYKKLRSLGLLDGLWRTQREMEDHNLTLPRRPAPSPK